MFIVQFISRQKLRISPQIFVKIFAMAPMGYSRAQGKVIHEKNELKNLVSDYLLLDE
jgi:hypothetical protein